jgi:hypothetical protein
MTYLLAESICSSVSQTPAYSAEPSGESPCASTQFRAPPSFALDPGAQFVSEIQFRARILFIIARKHHPFAEFAPEPSQRP